MTDILERKPAAAPMVELEAAGTDRSTAGEPGVAVRALLAVLCGAAAAIHFAMAPSHAAIWRAEGVAFALVAWIQAVLGVALAVRPSRSWLRLAVAANLVLLAVWGLSRTAGLPAGPHSGVAQAVTSVDLTAVVFEAAIVVVALAALVRPGLGRRLGEPALVVASLLPLAVVVLTATVLVSPSATARTSADAAAGVVAADGQLHGTAATPDDLGLAALENGHSHTHGPDAPMDAATKRQLAAQLAMTRQLMDKYPTVAAAEAAGYHRAGPFSPGLGAHYMPPKVVVNSAGTIDEASMAGAFLIYDGVTPDAPLAGFMFMAYRTTEPEGFAGTTDHWHFHTNVCLTTSPTGVIDAPLGADSENTTKELCDRYGGHLLDNTGYMIHVWTVPGYESTLGVFSDVNPAITCPDGTYHHIANEEIGTRPSTCLT